MESNKYEQRFETALRETEDWSAVTAALAVMALTEEVSALRTLLAEEFASRRREEEIEHEREELRREVRAHRALMNIVKGVVKAWDEALPGVADISKIDVKVLVAMGELKLALQYARQQNARQQTDDDSVCY